MGRGATDRASRFGALCELYDPRPTSSWASGPGRQGRRRRVAVGVFVGARQPTRSWLRPQAWQSSFSFTAGTEVVEDHGQGRHGPLRREHGRLQMGLASTRRPTRRAARRGASINASRRVRGWNCGRHAIDAPPARWRGWGLNCRRERTHGLLRAQATSRRTRRSRRRPARVRRPSYAPSDESAWTRFD